MFRIHSVSYVTVLLDPTCHLGLFPSSLLLAFSLLSLQLLPFYLDIPTSYLSLRPSILLQDCFTQQLRPGVYQLLAAVLPPSRLLHGRFIFVFLSFTWPTCFREIGTHLGICLSSFHKNRNSLVWVLLAVSVCPTSILTSLNSRPNLELASGICQS